MALVRVMLETEAHLDALILVAEEGLRDLHDDFASAKTDKDRSALRQEWRDLKGALRGLDREHPILTTRPRVRLDRTVDWDALLAEAESDGDASLATADTPEPVEAAS